VPQPLSEVFPPALRSAPKSASASSASITGFRSPECPVCGGSGWLRTDRDLCDPLFGKLSPCDCQGDRELARLRGLSGLNAHELLVTLSKLRADPGSGTERMVAACRTFIAQPSGFLTLWGGVGTGKTTCLQAITNALMRRGAVYVSLHELLAYVRGGYNSDAPDDTAHARLQRFESLPVLCLDEIDKVQGSPWVNEQLTALVDARFRSGVAGATGTVLALNQCPDDQPPWIASRLRDGRCCVVHNDGPDAREFMGHAQDAPPSHTEQDA
jgi:hypothetical protein